MSELSTETINAFDPLTSEFEYTVVSSILENISEEDIINPESIGIPFSTALKFVQAACALYKSNLPPEPETEENED